MIHLQSTATAGMRTILCLALVALTATFASASEQTARDRAYSFFSSEGARFQKRPAKTKANDLRVAARGDGWCLFTPKSSDSFVLVSDDENALVPVIGYGDFAGSSVPSQLEALLADFDPTVAYTTGHDPYGRYEAVQPLLGDISWHQNAPFNDNCPVVPIYETSGKAPAGCVATAAGMILKYWSASPGYDWNKIRASYNGDYSAEEAAEIARLMTDIGSAVNMQYGALASEAKASDIPAAMSDKFGMSPSIFGCDLTLLNEAARQAIVLEELKARRPVCFAGQNGSGGHAFVIDGNTADGYLHVNWGWGGTSDGWFHPCLLSPARQGTGGTSAGYNADQQAIINFRPAEAGDAVWSSQLMLGSIKPVTPLIWNVAITHKYEYYGSAQIYPTSLPDACEMAISIRSEEGAELLLLVPESATTSTDATRLTLPDFTLPDGTYRVFPMIRKKGMTDYQHLWADKNGFPYALLTVENGVKRASSIAIPAQPELSVSNIAFPESINPWNDPKLHFTLTNTGAAAEPQYYLRLKDEQTGAFTDYGHISADARTTISHGQTMNIELALSPMFFNGNTYGFQGDRYCIYNYPYDSAHTYSAELYIGDPKDEYRESSLAGTAAGLNIDSRTRAFADFKDAAIAGSLSKHDIDKDGLLSDYEQYRITEIDIPYDADVQTLEDIRDYKRITSLFLRNSSIREIELEGFENLYTFSVSNCPDLKSIKLPGCPGLGAVNIDECPNLEVLEIPDATFESWSQAVKQYLFVTDNRSYPNLMSKLRKLDLSNAHSLDKLSIGTQGTLEELIIAADAPLVSLTVIGAVTKAQLPDDLSNLEWLYLDGWLTDLDLSGKESKLKEAYIHNHTGRSGAITFPDAMPEVINFEVVANTESLTLPKSFAKLSYLYLNGSLSKNLTMPADAPKLNQISIRENKVLEAITFPAPLPALEDLTVSQSAIRELTLDTEMPALKTLSLYDNLLEKLVVKNAPALEKVSASDNELTETDLHGAPNIEVLNLNRNKFEKADFNYLPKLKELWISGAMMFYDNSNPNLKNLHWEGVRRAALGDKRTFDLAPYIKDGLDMSKVHPFGCTTLEGTVLTEMYSPGYSGAPEIGYHYGDPEKIYYEWPDESTGSGEEYELRYPGYVSIVDDNDRFTLSRDEMAIPVGGSSKMTAKFSDCWTGHLYCSSTVLSPYYHFEPVTYECDYGRNGHNFTFTRNEEVDVLFTFKHYDQVETLLITTGEDNWQDAVEEIDSAPESEAEVVGLYDLMGNRLAAPLEHGVTIEVRSDGSSRKILK